MIDPFAELLGDDPTFRTVIHAAAIAAATDVTLLLLGESGTGKELLAQAIHRGSERAAAPFCAINCAALPEALAESELFGHRRGAFSGAVSDQPGRVGAAHGGTLFLDEVGELSLAVQAKLLRFLESGECQPVGATAPCRSDVRIIAATHRDLQQQVASGAFREDLYYRLHVVPLTLPPLRQRRSDITQLIAHFNQQLARHHRRPAPHYAADALRRLQQHDWPGNLRELRNLCERLLVLHSGATLTAADLPLPTPGESGQQSRLLALPATGLRLDELEQSLIRQALDRSAGNRSGAARLLGLTRDTLLYRLKKYAIGR